MDVIVTAGGIPQLGEPLYPYTQGQPKALLDIWGKPMIQWVLDAISAAKAVENVVVTGLTAESGLNCAKPLTYIPNRVSMIENILAGIRKVLDVHTSATRVLVISSDIPAVTAEIIDWEVAAAMQSEVDIFYNVAKRETVEKRYPGSRRTYLKLKDVEVCSADMNVVSTSLVSRQEDIWTRLIEARKNPLKEAYILGLDTLLLVLLRQITLDRAVKKVTGRLHLTGRAIITPYAEMAMDVDKLHQFELVKADLAKRVGN